MKVGGLCAAVMSVSLALVLAATTALLGLVSADLLPANKALEGEDGATATPPGDDDDGDDDADA